MKDLRDLVTPNAIPKSKKEAIIAAVNAHPDRTYIEIGAEFGVSDSTVSSIMTRSGFTRRKDPPLPTRNAPQATKPGEQVRAGGIVATDEQWAARHHRIGGC